MPSTSLNQAAASLKAMLETGDLIQTPACFDALSARMIEAAGFKAGFMSGFAVSATRLGAPDVGLVSASEMLDQARNICLATTMPVIVDGDTGYGNAMNVKRTVTGLGRAGAAAVMIEDQIAPKRCGHTKGKLVVGFDEAVERVRAAVDARDETAGTLILARTDARENHGLDEAIARAQAFAAAGADIVFVEAPQSVEEMRRICAEIPAPSMANMLEGGATPFLPASELQEIGFAIAAYPLTMLSAAMKAMEAALKELRETGMAAPDRLLAFPELRQKVGFDDYYAQEARYADRRD